MTRNRSSKILITAALPYANGPLHFGHIAGAYLPADCYARFQRLKGADVLYLCGSDEYGIAITLSAEIAKRTPKEHVDLYHEINVAFFSKFKISFDHFSRTTWPGHVETTQQFFLDLLKKGYIEEKITPQLYSESDQRFLADRYVIGTCPKCGFSEARGDECQRCGASYEAMDLKNPRSKITGKPLILKETKHWFLCFDLFKDSLREWISSKEWKSNVLNFAKSYIEDLRPRAITRDSDWGVPIPLPHTDGKVFYVWFDAPIGYISAAREWAQKNGREDAWKDYWFDPDTKFVQFIGKDNIPFHAVFFPAMVMGQSQPYKLVDELPANEFYNLEGRQFSKSEGWMIDLDSFFRKFSSDQIRYVIAANSPETQDSEFSWKDFQMRCNSELVGKFGNLVNRTLVFCRTHCEYRVPPKGVLDEVDRTFLDKISHLVEDAALAFENFHLRKAAQCMMELSQVGNVYFDLKKPWISVKTKESRAQMETTIYCCIQCLKMLALISLPIIPDAATSIWKFLGNEEPIEKLGWDSVKKMEICEGTLLLPSEILFKKVEDEMIQEELIYLSQLKAKLQNKEESSHTDLKEKIDIEDVRKIDLRIGQILEAERIPKSKKLLKLNVDLGFEKRIIVAGIGAHLEDLQSLIGKKVVIVANLKTTQIMGVESQGMLLAANSESGLELLELKISSLGTQVS